MTWKQTENKLKQRYDHSDETDYDSDTGYDSNGSGLIALCSGAISGFIMGLIVGLLI